MIREFFQALEAAFPPNPPGHGQPRLLAGPKDAPGTVSLELFLPDRSLGRVLSHKRGGAEALWAGNGRNL